MSRKTLDRLSGLALMAAIGYALFNGRQEEPSEVPIFSDPETAA